MSDNGHLEQDREWVSLGSIAGFYRLDHPAEWRVERDENMVTLCAPNMTGTITITAFHGGPLPAETLSTLLGAAVRPAAPVSPAKPVSHRGWNGHCQAFVNGESGRTWLGLVAQRHKVFVLLTASDDAQQMDRMRPIFQRVFDSLRLQDPELDVGWPSD